MKKDNEVLVDEKDEVKDKNKKILIILVGVIFVVGCYFVGYFVGTKIGAKEEDNEKLENIEEKEDDANLEKDENGSIEKLDINSDVVKKLFEVFREDKPLGFEYIKSDINTSLESKKYVAFQQLANSDFVEKSCDSLSIKEFWDDERQTRYECGQFDYEKSEINYISTSTFDANILETKYKEIFGLKAEYVNDDFQVGALDLAHYEQDKNLYALFTVVGGIETEYKYIHTLENIIQTGNILILDTKLVSDFILDDDPSYDKVSNIKYTFELEEETGNYIFVSREEK